MKDHLGLLIEVRWHLTPSYLKMLLAGGVKILDMACGGGANEYYFGRKYPSSEWTGMDIDDGLFHLFEEYGGQLPNVKLVKGDWFSIDRNYIGKYDGVISIQSLSWLPKWKRPMEEMCKLNPKWIAISSLFYEGDIEYFIKLSDYERMRDEMESVLYYNIYAIPRLKLFFREHGYTDFKYEPFEIDIDIPRPIHKDIGTYTIKTEEGKRMQISAAMLMPWYFVYAGKDGGF